MRFIEDHRDAYPVWLTCAVLDAANRIWLADITYIPTEEGWLYLAAIMDLFSRNIVGWAMRDHMQVGLVSSASTMAFQQQQPEAGLTLSLRSRRAIRRTRLSRGSCPSPASSDQ